ncbi:MAG: hypothetical protein K2M77_08585, partial [Muribaculaceae bacterium]|nr:hypothetical protein [Muribaculaceae bacterium]
MFKPFPLRNGNGTVENFLYRGFKDEYLYLCRYTREDNLSDLINGKWKVFQRWTFSDKHERGEYPGTLNFYFDSASKDIDWEYTN